MQQAAGAGNTGQRQGMLDDYNPFAEGNQTRPAGGVSIEYSFVFYILPLCKFPPIVSDVQLSVPALLFNIMNFYLFIHLFCACLLERLNLK